MLRIFIVFSIILLLTGVDGTAESAGLALYSGVNAGVPKPRLVSPVSEEVFLRDAIVLTFRWSPHEGRSIVGPKYYDFRIYKGTDMVESALIFKKKVSGSLHMLNVPASLFENGSTYTWSMRLVYKALGKSNRSVQAFKVIK